MIAQTSHSPRKALLLQIKPSAAVKSDRRRNKGAKRIKISLQDVWDVIGAFLLTNNLNCYEEKRAVSDLIRDLCILNSNVLLRAANHIIFVDGFLCFDDQIICTSALRLLQVRDPEAAFQYAAEIQARTVHRPTRDPITNGYFSVMRKWTAMCHGCGKPCTPDGYEDEVSLDDYGQMRLRDYHCCECAYDPFMRAYRVSERMAHFLFDHRVLASALVDLVITGSTHSWTLQSLVDAYNRRIIDEEPLVNTPSLRAAIDEADHLDDAAWHAREWPVDGHTDETEWDQAIDRLCCHIFEPELGLWGYTRFFDPRV